MSFSNKQLFAFFLLPPKSEYHQQITKRKNTFSRKLFPNKWAQDSLKSFLSVFALCNLYFFPYWLRLVRTSFLSNFIFISLFEYWRTQWLLENNRLEGTLAPTYDWLSIKKMSWSSIWQAELRRQGCYSPEGPRVPKSARPNREASGAKGRDGCLRQLS